MYSYSMYSDDGNLLIPTSIPLLLPTSPLPMCKTFTAIVFETTDFQLGSFV